MFPVNEKKEMHVETIRGLACIALVSYHVVGSQPTSGMSLPADDWLSILQQCLADVRMPLFTFVSGYVFVAIARPGTEWYQLLLKKVRRLLLPLVSVTTLFWLVRHMLGYQQTPLYLAYFWPYEHFWFLQSTFLLMTSLLVLNALCADRNGALTLRQDVRNASLIGLVGAAVYISSGMVPVHVFSVFHAVHLAPFFMAGHVLGVMGRTTFAQLPRTARPVAASVLLACIVLGTTQAFGLLSIDSAELRRGLSLLAGLGAAFALFALRPRNRVLSWIGDKSYAIYLFHVFFTAATQMVWNRMFPGAEIHLVYLPALVAGLLGPILVQYLILRSPVASWLLLGMRRPVFRKSDPASA